MSLRRLWLPRTLTIVRRGPGGGMPNGSPSPCTTSTGTSTAASSDRRSGATVPDLRAGGCSGKARHSTPAAPVVAAGGPPADDDGPPAQAIGAKLLEHGDPGRVELVRRGRRAPSGDAVRLLDER